ncbi:MAG: condensation domain-containing protein [Acidimicrobiales bacterium]
MTTEVTPVQRVPFNVVDEVVRLLDTETEPWSIQLELEVAAGLDEARLRDSLAQALARHPMARARKAPTGRRRERQYQWEITPEPEVDPLRALTCPDEEALATARAELLNRSVPLAESPPLRVWWARREGGDVLMVNANHAAMDGFGTVRFVQSLARAYAGQPDPLPDVDPNEARNVGAVVGTDDTPTRLRRAWLLAEKARDAAVPPSRIAPDGQADRAGYGFVQDSLSEERTRRLVEEDRPGTVNDAMVAALHLAIAGWNDEHGTPAGRIGVMVPVNVRPPGWQQEVVGNLLLPVRVTTRRADRSSPRAALEAVARQTRKMKEGGTGGALIEVLGRSPSFPLSVKEATSPALRLLGNRLADTALLSNLGELEPLSFGEAGPTTALWFSAPARMPLGLSVGVVTTGGRLFTVLRYRHPLFGDQAARRFADRYLAAIDEVMSV